MTSAMKDGTPVARLIASAPTNTVATKTAAATTPAGWRAASIATTIPKARRLSPWWMNLNDRNDVLGMPLGPAGDGYAEMVTNGEIEDRWIKVGNIVTSLNPLSHNAYWTDRDFYKVAAGMIRGALAIADAQ
jgi:hypothetical protein